jgi:hypothetical protein
MIPVAMIVLVLIFKRQNINIFKQLLNWSYISVAGNLSVCPFILVAVTGIMVLQILIKTSEKNYVYVQGVS